MAQDCFLTFGICRQMIMMQPGKLSILPLESKQWGIIPLKNGKGTISLPISAEILFCALQHYGITPQYYGCNGKSVVGSLKDDDTASWVALCK